MLIELDDNVPSCVTKPIIPVSKELSLSCVSINSLSST